VALTQLACFSNSQFLSTELSLEQLDVGLREGRVELRDIDLNLDVISATVTTCSLASVALVRLSLPASLNLASDSCVVELSGVRIEFVPSLNPAPAKRVVSVGDEKPSPKPAAVEESKSDLQQGLDFLAQWIERVTSRVRVEVRDVQIAFKDDASDTAVSLFIDRASYFDDSNSGPAHKRRLVVRGVRMDLTRPQQLQATPPCLLLQLSSEVASTAHLVLNKRKHRPAEVPLVEAECSVHWVDLRVCPESLQALQVFFLRVS